MSGNRHVLILAIGGILQATVLQRQWKAGLTGQSPYTNWYQPAGICGYQSLAHEDDAFWAAPELSSSESKVCYTETESSGKLTQSSSRRWPVKHLSAMEVSEQASTATQWHGSDQGTDQAVHLTMIRRQEPHSSFQIVKGTGPTPRVVGSCSNLMVSEEDLKAHSVVTATLRKSDTVSEGTMALEVTANRKKKASTVTPEDDLTDVSDAELTIPVTQAVTGPIALSPQTPSASVQVDPEIVK